jgi:hypothetical protein
MRERQVQLLGPNNSLLARSAFSTSPVSALRHALDCLSLTDPTNPSVFHPLKRTIL